MNYRSLTKTVSQETTVATVSVTRWCVVVTLSVTCDVTQHLFVGSDSTGCRRPASTW